jgi:hypothetical protein
MNVVPLAAWTVDPSPPVVASDEPEEGVDPPGPPPDLEPPPDELDLTFDSFNLGLITVKYTGTITATIIKANAAKRRTTRTTERRFDLGDVVVVVVGRKMGSSSCLLASNVPESFGVAFKYDSRGESEVRGTELEAM